MSLHHAGDPDLPSPTFSLLLSPTAERALTAEDAELSSLVASVLQITSATEVSAGGWEGAVRPECWMQMVQAAAWGLWTRGR